MHSDPVEKHFQPFSSENPEEFVQMHYFAPELSHVSGIVNDQMASSDFFRLAELGGFQNSAVPGVYFSDLLDPGQSQGVRAENSYHQPG